VTDLGAVEDWLDFLRGQNAFPPSGQPLVQTGTFTIAQPDSPIGVVVPPVEPPTDPSLPDDACPGTPDGVPENASGCSIDQLCPWDGGWPGPQDYRDCVHAAADAFLAEGVAGFTSADAQAAKDAADSSECGDACPGTLAGEIEGVNGCSIGDTCPCAGPADGGEWVGPGEYRACAQERAEEMLAEGSLDQAAYDATSSAIASSECGDRCPGTPAGEIEDLEGCSLSQRCPCEGPAPGVEWVGPEEYRACVAVAAGEMLDEGTFDQAAYEEAIVDAAASECGDRCPGTPLGEEEDAQGCSVSQLCPCEGIDGVPWAGPGEYRTCVEMVSTEFVTEEVFDQARADELVAEANASECGDKCPGTPEGEPEDAEGCSVSQRCPCEGPGGAGWSSRGEYIQCTRDTAEAMYADGFLLECERKDAIKAALCDDCGKNPCRTKACKLARYLKSKLCKANNCKKEELKDKIKRILEKLRERFRPGIHSRCRKFRGWGHGDD